MTADKKNKAKATNKSKVKAAEPKKVEVKKKVVVKKKVDSTSSAPKKGSKVEVQTKKVTAMKVAQEAIYATGRRKESTAKVWLFKGTGKMMINSMAPLDYLSSDRLVTKVMTPLEILNLNGKYDVRIDVIGGGLSGQADASTLGIARAVLSISEDFRSTLREYGLLTQDRREKERKKYGKRGARKSPQFRKR